MHKANPLFALALFLAVGTVLVTGAVGLSSRQAVAPTVGDQASAGSCTNEFELVKPGGVVCRKTGCSGTVCSDRDMVSNCAYQEVYSCYQTAKCEVQASGQCGWTQDLALKSCLSRYGSDLGTAIPNPKPKPRGIVFPTFKDIRQGLGL